jgi:hypothetical protein
MILDPQVRAERQESALVSHIAAEVEALCGTSSVDLDRVKELAHAVEHFLQEHGNGEFVDSRYLLLLTSQALASVGDAEVGRRLFLFGSGMVRPAEWEVRGRETVWALDLRQMTVRDDACIELLFFNGLRIVLDSIAEVWDAFEGRGVLGLRHVCSVASDLLGRGSSKKEVARLSDEIRDLCRRRLERIGSERGWAAVPEVMNLDLV